MTAPGKSRGQEKAVPGAHELGGWALGFDPGGTLTRLSFRGYVKLEAAPKTS